MDNPAEHNDFGDRGRLLSCDSIESVEETRPERHLRWLREANSDPYAGVSNEIDDLDRDILQPHVPQPASPRAQNLATAHANQQAIQRAYIEESGVTSDTAISILGWDTQQVIGLASSSRLSSQQPGVSVNNATTDSVPQVSHLSSQVQESVSPDNPPKVSVQPFIRIGGDFRLPSNPTQSQNPPHSSSSN